MKNPFSIGDEKKFLHVVQPPDVAAFEDGGLVHPVYSTFALARDAEWSGRLFVLEMKEETEEGIGAGLEIRHLSPALLGSTVEITATLTCVEKNIVETQFTARVADRIIATGRQWQKIVRKEKLEALFNNI